MWRSSRELAFCHIGDSKWTPADDKAWHGMIMDITYYGGRIYTCDVNLCIRAWDTTKTGKVTRLPKDVVNAYYADGDLTGVYSMGLDDGERKRLLVVLRKGIVDYDNGVHYQTQPYEYCNLQSKYISNLRIIERRYRSYGSQAGVRKQILNGLIGPESLAKILKYA
ncbi:hypothetical protein Tco_1171734 [Tanacetum coccineum]